jgi:NuA3 HAT complex component NTO1
MKMKSPNTSGLLQDSNLKALCHRHVPADWREENDVDAAFEDAQEFYQALFSDTNGNENPAWDANTTAGENGEQDAAGTGGDMADDDITSIPKRRGDSAKRKTVTATSAEQQPQKPVWKLPSGAPVIPAVLYETIITSLSRFGLPAIRDFAAEVCKYWTLKREARRGASLVRRLQVQTDSNSFTSLEVVRKNYGALGKTQGGIKLEHRKEYADKLERDLVGLVDIIGMVRSKEDKKVNEMRVEGEWLERMYFPECKLMREVLAEAEKYVFPCRLAGGLSASLYSLLIFVDTRRC